MLDLAASGVLLQQIGQGAPVDVFASADQETMNRGVEQKHIDTDTRKEMLFRQNKILIGMVDDHAAHSKQEVSLLGTVDSWMVEAASKLEPDDPADIKACRALEEATIGGWLAAAVAGSA